MPHSRSATSIVEGRQVDALSVLRGASGTNVVLTVHVNSVLVVGLTLVVVVLVLAVVFLWAIGTLHGCALHELSDINLFLLVLSIVFLLVFDAYLFD